MVSLEVTYGVWIMSFDFGLALAAIGQIVVRDILPHVGEAAESRRHAADMYRRGYRRRTLSIHWESQGEKACATLTEAVKKMADLNTWCDGNWYGLTDDQWSYARGVLKFVNRALYALHGKHVVPPKGLTEFWGVEPLPERKAG